MDLKGRRPMVAATIDAPRHPDNGEDAPAVAIIQEGSAWIGVFDGMGGSGASTYVAGGNERTGAYLGARTAAAAFEEWVADLDWTSPGDELGPSLHACQAQALRNEYAKLHTPPTRLRSKLLRALPTTVAVGGVSTARAPSGTYDVAVLWAGDSRVYLAIPDPGLIQLTRDHLTSGADPQENLGDDSPISNCASADVPFFVEELHLTVWTPFILLAATDGCFGYLDAPVCFEDLLLRTLLKARSLDKWKRSLTEAIIEVTGDDASLAMLLVGWQSLAQLQKAFRARASLVSPMSEQIRLASERAREARLEVIRREEERRRIIDATWEHYRTTYEHPLDTQRYGE